jgi:phosphate acyltransferase
MGLTPRIAIDAMGGDGGVRVMVAGAAAARHRHSGLKFLLVGDEVQIKAALENHPNLRAAAEIIHTEGVVSGDDKPGQALRKARGSSMGLAIDAVKRGDAGGAVSSGNTGALMAMAKLALRTMPGIDRPALAALLPTLGDNDVVMLDLGANTECDANNSGAVCHHGVGLCAHGAGFGRTARRVAQYRHRRNEGHRFDP